MLLFTARICKAKIYPAGFAVEIRPAQTFLNPVRPFTTVKGNPAVAGLFGVNIAVGVTLGEVTVIGALKWLDPGLLKTDKISFLRWQPIKKAFSGSRTNTVAV